ncbi:MAG: ABC transporter substrate-binding protein [Chloroflexi bacterium]|nr:ABC transporter substrate-binding protein [Chloroflexota bacterium]
MGLWPFPHMGWRAARGWPWLLLLVVLLAASCAREKETVKVSMALDWYPWSNHAGLYEAQKQGYYASEGLDVNIYTPSDPSTVLQTVGAGKDDFGISYQAEVLLARSQGIPVVSIAGLVQHPLNSVMTLKESGITRPKQLEGKTVGTPGIPADEPMLKTMVEKDGGDFSKVKLVNIGFDLVPALIGKKVDAIVGAYWVHESIVMGQQGYPVNVMRMEQWGVPDFYELVLVASEKTVTERPDVVKRFMQATLKGYADARKDLDKAVETLAAASPQVDQKVEKEGIRLLAPLWTEKVPAFGWQETEKWRAFAQWMQDNKLLDKPVDPEKAYTNQFVAELVK